MNGITRFLTSSVGRKYLMAVTGMILALFVLGHACGNLQFFLSAHWINNYAYHLQHLPYGLLWVIRAVLFLTIAIHIVVGVSLTLHNMQARPGYEVDATLQASIGARTMIWTGLLILAFAVFHLLHYTVKDIQDFSAIPLFSLEGVGDVPNVQAIMHTGFSVTWYSIAYIVAVFCLMMHLSHGVTSVFQTMGWRNERTRYGLDKFAWVYALAVFCFFASIPLSVLIAG